MDIITSTDPGVTPAETRIARQALTALHTHYPGHQWGTEMQGAHMIIRHRALTGRYGFRINMLITNDISKAATIAGGEILERYRQPRGVQRQDRFQDSQRNNLKVFMPDD